MQSLSLSSFCVCVESFHFVFVDGKCPSADCGSKCFCREFCHEVQRVVFYDSTSITERHGRVLGTSGGTEQDPYSLNHFFQTIPLN